MKSKFTRVERNEEINCEKNNLASSKKKRKSKNGKTNTQEREKVKREHMEGVKHLGKEDHCEEIRES